MIPMKTSLNILRVVLAAFAAFIIASSRYAAGTGGKDNHTSAAVWAVLTFASVTFLHWLLLRYIVVDGLRPSLAPKQLQVAGDSGYSRSFFRGTTGIGYLSVFLYVSEIFYRLDLVRNGPTQAVPTGFLLVGVTFLFLGLIARARGIIVSLMEKRITPPPTAA